VTLDDNNRKPELEYSTDLFGFHLQPGFLVSFWYRPQPPDDPLHKILFRCPAVLTIFRIYKHEVLTDNRSSHYPVVCNPPHRPYFSKLNVNAKTFYENRSHIPVTSTLYGTWIPVCTRTPFDSQKISNSITVKAYAYVELQ